MKTLWLVVCVVAGAGCFNDTSKCATTCMGCCDATGSCQPGTSALSCGADGDSCGSCGGALVCVGGQCVASGSAGAGGSDTGGGAGGGAAVGGGRGGGLGSGGGVGTTGGSGGTSASEMNAWVMAHNAARAAAMPVPTPALPTVDWSTAAEAQARSWAAGCRFVHSMAPGFGENLYAGTRLPTPAQVTNDWVSEVSDYTYSSNRCATGKQCGHYTQVVWRSSIHIGCVVQFCTTNTPFGSQFPTWYLAVCNYTPPGNFVGMKPY